MRMAQPITWERTVDYLLGPGLMILATVVLAVLARWLLHRLITRTVATMSSRAASARSGAGPTLARHTQRMATMGSLLRSVVTVVISTIAVLTVMAIVGLPLGPLLASAGVGGVALGFGAQSLVKDFLSGVFMILEDQYGVGDVIDTGEVVGTVEEVTLRTTRVVDVNGVTWYIRNGEIIRIGNKSQGLATTLVDIPVAVDADAAVTMTVMRAALAELATVEETATLLVGEPQVLGVESIAHGAMTIRVQAQCVPGEQATVARVVRERVKAALDSAGIRPPTPTPYGGGSGGTGGNSSAGSGGGRA